MNGKKYLPDTNIIIGIFAEETKVIARLIPGIQIFVPIVSLGELYFGAQKSVQVDENLKKFLNWQLAPWSFRQIKKRRDSMASLKMR